MFDKLQMDKSDKWNCGIGKTTAKTCTGKMSLAEQRSLFWPTHGLFEDKLYGVFNIFFACIHVDS